jgi:hypothetical protein
MLRIVPVESSRALADFIRLPWRIYRGNSCWVPPLVAEQRRALRPGGNPFFEHSRAQLFLAEQDGQPEGRIAAIENRRHLEVYADGTGFFGFFECVEDAAVARALLDAAGDWVRASGLARLRGPTSFTINDECGLLLDAYDRPPVLLMPYNPPSYPALLEGCGFSKAQDLLAYRLTWRPRRRQAARSRRSGGDNGAHPQRRPVRFDEELERLTRHSAAWAENWGAVPLSREESGCSPSPCCRSSNPSWCSWPRSGRTVRRLGDARRLQPGAAPSRRISCPSAGQAVLASPPIDAVRVLIMGVLPSHRHRGIDAAF